MKWAQEDFFLLIQTLPTFWAERILILRIFIFGIFWAPDFWTTRLPGPGPYRLQGPGPRALKSIGPEISGPISKNP